MDSVHHIWCPLSSQEFQDLPDGAETTLTEWATIQAGFYDEYQMPDGSRRRVAKSISFASMDDSQFNGVYKSVLNVLWNYILRRKFHSPAEAENAASQLLSFAG